MSPGENSPPPQNISVSWRELTEFISGQTEKDRKLINWWFTFAAALIALIVTVAGIIGFRSIEDAKRAAAAAAQDAAKEKVASILNQPDFQKLVEDEARRLFAKGAFKKTTEDAVRAQIPPAVQAEIVSKVPGLVLSELARRHVLPRRISADVERAFLPKLRVFVAGKRILIGIVSDRSQEATDFAADLARVLNGAGLNTGQLAMAADPMVGTRLDINGEKSRSLANAIADLIERVMGQRPQIQGSQGGDDSIGIWVGTR